VSRVEMKRWRIRCDGWPACDVVEFVDEIHLPSLPDGWGIHKVRDCGMTGYTRHDELCPACLAKRATRG